MGQLFGPRQPCCRITADTVGLVQITADTVGLVHITADTVGSLQNMERGNRVAGFWNEVLPIGGIGLIRNNEV